MKLLFRCAVASLVFCAVMEILSTRVSSWAPALLCWPGIVAVDAVCARLGFYESGAPSVLPWFLPGLLFDVVMYALVFWAMSVVWQVVRTRRAPAGN